MTEFPQNGIFLRSGMHITYVGLFSVEQKVWKLEWVWNLITFHKNYLSTLFGEFLISRPLGFQAAHYSPWPNPPWPNLLSCKFIPISLLWKKIINSSCTVYLLNTEVKIKSYWKFYKIVHFMTVSGSGINIWWCHQ